MSDETALTFYKDAADLVISATGQLDFGKDSPTVDWAELSETIDPQGKLIKASDLDGQTFAIRRMKMFESSFQEGPEWVYWIVAENDSLGVFNTVLGGRAVVDELDKIVEINRRAKEAYQSQDNETLRHYLSVGAGKRPVIRLELKKAGKFGRYYVISRDRSPTV